MSLTDDWKDGKLAPCDYEELQRLKEENDDLSALITSGELEIGHLRQLLRECKEVFEELKKDRGVYFNNANLTDLLTKINEVMK